MKNVLVSCLEVSADHLISHFIRYCLDEFPDEFNFFCIAGEEVKKIDHPQVTVINDLITLGNIGLVENLRHSVTYIKFINWFKGFITEKSIDIFLAVDGQGINIPLGNITKGNITKGNITKGNITKGNITKGNITKGNITKGNITKSSITKNIDKKGDEEKSIKNVYFFPPPVFTFGRSILKKMHAFDLLLCPFEKDHLVYKKKGFNSHYVGHPYLDLYNSDLYKDELFKKPENLIKGLKELFHPKGKTIAPKTIALFPGSRTLEIKKNTKTILQVVKKLRGGKLKGEKLAGEKIKGEFNFVISLSHESYLGYLQDELKKADLDLPIYHSASDYIIKNSFFIIATSGTTTLKASFAGVPHVIVYRLNPITYFLYKLLSRLKVFIYTPYIGTVNVYMEKEVMPELMNRKFNAKNIIRVIKSYSENPRLYQEKRQQLLSYSQEFSIDKNLTKNYDKNNNQANYHSSLEKVVRLIREI